MRKTTTARGRNTSDQSPARRPAPGSSIVRRQAKCRFVAAVCGAAALAGALLAPSKAEAQEILLTGPLAGAGAVHELRLYRKGRVEFAPTATFTLLDEYLRQILVGARLNYNVTDFLAIGVWGAFSPEPLKLPAGLVDKIQQVNSDRASGDATSNAARRSASQQPLLQNRLTSLNLGSNFEDQLGSIDWIAAPQVTFVPFRGKIALFQSIYIDTDFYIFAGPAIASVTERKDCSGPTSTLVGGCSSERQPNDGVVDAAGNPIPIPNAETFPMASRIAIAPTFGLGFTFFVNRWNALGFEWRAVPFARNTGGFDNHGTGPDGDFPDQQVNSDDRDLKLNQMLSVSWNFYIPFDYQVSE
jgi:hypothetical protein